MLYVLDLYLGSKTKLKLTTNDRFLRKFFMAILFTPRVFDINRMREIGQRNISLYLLLLEMSDRWFVSLALV